MTKTRFAKEIGTSAHLRIYWGEGCPKMGWHNALKPLTKSDKTEDWTLGGNPEDYSNELWPIVCECGAPVPVKGEAFFEQLTYQVHRNRLYDTPSGKLEPGDMYWNTWLPENANWDNHVGPHLEVICPDGFPWNIDSRAENCTLPQDRNHRCWCRHGEPPEITVDKNGLTCQAGAGSIQTREYHGMLQNGHFNP